MKLKPLLLPENIIKEIGDFKQIPAYQYNMRIGGNDIRFYSFTDENHNFVRIDLQPVNMEELIYNAKELNIPINAADNFIQYIKNRNIYGIGFNVNDSEKQGVISDQSLLLKILATIQKIVMDFINAFHPKVFVFASAGLTNKNDNVNWVDNKKTRLFKRVVEEQLKELTGWRMKVIGGFTFIYDSSIEKNETAYATTS